MVVAKARAFALDHEVEDGERDGGLSEGDPSSGLSQEPGHGTAVIKDDRIPDGKGGDEDVLEPLGREGVRRIREKRLCKFEEGFGDLAGGELLRDRPLGWGGRTLALVHGFLTCTAHGSRTKRSGSRAQAQRPRRGTRWSMPLCPNVHNALATDPCQEHARMACDSDAGARHRWGLTDARTACRRVERAARRGAQGPRPRGKVTVPGCAMAARAARSR